MSKRFQRILKLAELLNTDNSCNGVCVQVNSIINKMAHFEPVSDGTTPNPWRKNMDYAKYENSPYFGSVSEFLDKFPGGIKDWLKWRKDTQQNRNTLWDIKKATQNRISKIEDLMKNAEEELSVGDIVTAQEGSVFGLLENSVVGIILKKKSVSGKIMYLVDPLDIEKDAKKMGQSTWVPGYMLNKSSLEEINKTAHYEPVGKDDVDKFKDEPKLYSDEGVEKFKSVKEFLDKRSKEMNQSVDDAAQNAVKDFIDYWKILLKKKKD
jgi:hypothetical protein